MTTNPPLPVTIVFKRPITVLEKKCYHMQCHLSLSALPLSLLPPTPQWYELISEGALFFLCTFIFLRYLWIIDEIAKKSSEKEWALKLNFRYCEKATQNLKKYPTLFWHYLVKVNLWKKLLCTILNIQQNLNFTAHNWETGFGFCLCKTLVQLTPNDSKTEKESS